MISTEAQAREWIEGLEEADALCLERLERFDTLLREENTRQNLVSARSLDFIWSRHFADSLQLLRDVPRVTDSWLDLGTGAGLPGLVIAIARPEQETVCVESRGLRTDFLVAASEDLGLSKCKIVHRSLKDAETRKFAVISARAFAPLPKLLDLSARFSTPETLWRLPKGRSAAQELSELTGWEHMFHVEQSLTDPNAGIICGTLEGRRKGKRS